MGAGAGYEVEFDGIELELKKYKITDVKENQVFFDVPLKKGICDYWKAEGYYEGVDSEGIYYDGELMMEYDKYDREIVGGTAHCWLDISCCDWGGFEDIDNPTNEEIDEYILEYMQRSIDIKWMYGGGWSHCNLDPKGFTLGGDSPYKEDVRKDDTTEYSYEFCVLSVDIVAPNMAEDVNWYFEHSYELEKIFFGEDEEIEESKKSSKSIREDRTKNILDKVYDSLVKDEDYRIDQTLSLSDFENDDRFFIPASSYHKFPKKRAKTNSYTFDAYIMVNGEKHEFGIVVVLPSDEHLDAQNRSFEEIRSYMLLVQEVFTYLPF